MSHLEMRNFDRHYNSDDTEMSAQERLLYNNNYNSNHHHHLTHHNNHSSHSGDSENHYQLPYAHLHQSPYLHHQHALQHQQGSYSSDDHSSLYTPRHLNGHVAGSPYSQGTLQDKYIVAYPGRDDTVGRRCHRTSGSGIVYRPRRKLYWVMGALALLLLIIAATVVIVMYFAVLRRDTGATPHADAASGVGNKTKAFNEAAPDHATKPPEVYGIPITSSQPLPQPRPFVPESVGIKIQKFDAYWHPGDSRLFVSTFTNGTIVQVFGPKKSDGTVKSVYSLSVTDSGGITRSVRFLGQRNLASVVLPSGVIVSYDWSANNIDMEIKVFEPYTEQARGPISHLAVVEVGVRSYLLRQISKVMDDLREDPVSGGSRRSSTKCFSRFPVMVTKCGGQYPYDGAFVQGVITGIEKPITMAALPWPKEADPCYEQDSGVVSNYYLPLPGNVDNENATMIKEAYVASSARLYTELCNIISDQVFLEHHSLCSDMGDKVRKKLSRHQLLGIIFDSCSAILNALHTACVAISGVASADNMPSLTEYGLLRSLTRRLSDSFQPGLPEQVDLKAHAFCPSSLPLSSYQSTVDIHTVGGIVNDVIHINCPDYPEVTYVDLDHLLTKSEAHSPLSPFDLVKHKMRVCSICAFEKTVTAQIDYDEMLCNNTCLKTNTLENIPDLYLTETKHYLDQDSVYCHDFLTSVDNTMDPIGRQCLGNCMSHLHVRFEIKDPKDNMVYYDQTVQCSELRSHACKMKFGK